MLFSSKLEIVVSFEVKPRSPYRVIVAIARMGSSSLSDQLSNQSEGSSFPLTLNEFLTVLGPKKELKSLRDVSRQINMIVSTNIAKYCLLTLVKSRLALASPVCLFGCSSPCRK